LASIIIIHEINKEISNKIRKRNKKTAKQKTLNKLKKNQFGNKFNPVSSLSFNGVKSINFSKNASISSFDDYPISPATAKGLHEANFTKPTDIQRLSLGHSILGHDIVGAAKTGSGKTLALLIPVLIENL
jgi:ATP-dependent RNA helicase DDX10/DBP4